MFLLGQPANFYTADSGNGATDPVSLDALVMQSHSPMCLLFCASAWLYLLVGLHPFFFLPGHCECVHLRESSGFILSHPGEDRDCSELRSHHQHPSLSFCLFLPHGPTSSISLPSLPKNLPHPLTASDSFWDDQASLGSNSLRSQFQLYCLLLGQLCICDLASLSLNFLPNRVDITLLRANTGENHNHG